jgi:hypothetical protein
MHQVIGYNEKYIEESVNTKLLGLKYDNHINRKIILFTWFWN